MRRARAEFPVQQMRRADGPWPYPPSAANITRSAMKMLPMMLNVYTHCRRIRRHRAALLVPRKTRASSWTGMHSAIST